MERMGNKNFFRSSAPKNLTTAMYKSDSGGMGKGMVEESNNIKKIKFKMDTGAAIYAMAMDF